MNGDHARSAALLAALAEAQPDQPDLARKALERGARRRARWTWRSNSRGRSRRPSCRPRRGCCWSPTSLRRNRPDRALPGSQRTGDNGDLSFLAPLVDRLGRRPSAATLDRRCATVDQIPVNSLLGPLRAEERALILLKFRRTAEAEPFARRAIGPPARARTALRLAFADGFLAAGDRARALMMLDGMGIDAGAGARSASWRGKLERTGDRQRRRRP